MSHSNICPRCQTPLATDAPEGLCPACLMAGGLASAPSPAGSAATTPWTEEKRAAAIADLAPHFPQLEIIELLGQGGMGAVYKARQKHLDRLIALKVIPPEAAKEPAFAERFAREARALARLNHPNIVTVYDFGQSDGVYFLLMEFVDGLNLRQTMKSGNLSPQEALAIVPHVCDALQYAHDQGIVHRDVKPENVLLDKSGRVKIADFGLAKLLTHSPQDYTLTHSMQVMGTPRYMAPEQIEHPLDVDHRADIYSLGVMFYEMLTGELPMGRFAPPSQKVQIDIRIDEIVLRSLEKEPARRYQKASEVKTELETVKSSPHGSSPLVPPQASVTAAQPANTPAPLANLPQGTTGRVLVVALMFTFSLLIIGVGIMLGILPYVLGITTGDSLGYFGAAFGCIVGGVGGLFGTLNTYRQMAGGPDWMETEYRTWLDRLMLGYLFLGVGMLLLGWMQSSNVSSADDVRMGSALLVLGWIVMIQGALFLVYRATVGMQSPLKKSTTPATAESQSLLAEALRQVSAPGTGLVIAGFLGLLPLAILLVISVGSILLRIGSPLAHSRSPDLAALDATFVLAQSSSFPAPPPMGTPMWILLVPLITVVFQVPSSILMILGGRKMQRLETYGLSVTAGICALLPTGPVWIISMPIGIWALIVLASSEVREAFRAKRAGRGIATESPRPVAASAPALPSKPVDEWTIVNAKQQLFWPGLGLAGGGGLGLAAVLVNCLATATIPLWLPPPSDMTIYLGASIILLLLGLQVLFSLITIAAGMKMMRVENYRLALTGACFALLPLSPAAIVTMPLGIWAIVVLSSHGVREAFRQNAVRI
ncbi:MAG: serine/threonine-protein kinase [Pirellulaceae bacterium]